MKKHFIATAFTIVYALSLSVGLTCLLNLFGIALTSAVFNENVKSGYPKFVPFCIIVGILALAALIVTFVLNLKIGKKLEFTKKTWWIQMVSAFVISIPAVYFVQILFDLLQKTF